MKKYLLFILLLTSCAPQQVSYVHQPPITDHEENARQMSGDFAFCINQAQVSTHNVGYTDDPTGTMYQISTYTNLRDLCMRGRGWIRTQ